MKVSSIVIGDGGQEEGWVVCRIFKKKNHHKTLDSPISTTTTSSLTTETASSLLLDSCNDGALEQIIQYMGRTCKEIEEEEEDAAGTATGRLLRPIDTSSVVINAASGSYLDGRFSKLPNLESPNSTSTHNCYQPINNQVGPADPIIVSGYQLESSASAAAAPHNWAAFDRLVASQLNGQIEVSNMIYYSDQLPTTTLRGTTSFSSKSSSSSYNAAAAAAAQDYNNVDTELWSFARLSSSLSSTDPLCHVSDTQI